MVLNHHHGKLIDIFVLNLVVRELGDRNLFLIVDCHTCGQCLVSFRPLCAWISLSGTALLLDLAGLRLGLGSLRRFVLCNHKGGTDQRCSHERKGEHFVKLQFSTPDQIFRRGHS